MAAGQRMHTPLFRVIFLMKPSSAINVFLSALRTLSPTAYPQHYQGLLHSQQPRGQRGGLCAHVSVEIIIMEPEVGRRPAIITTCGLRLGSLPGAREPRTRHMLRAADSGAGPRVMLSLHRNGQGGWDWMVEST